MGAGFHKENYTHTVEAHTLTYIHTRIQTHTHYRHTYMKTHTGTQRCTQMDRHIHTGLGNHESKANV